MKRLIFVIYLFLLVSYCLKAQKSIGIQFGPVYESIKFKPNCHIENKGEFIGINIETFSKEKISLHSGISFMRRSYDLTSVYPKLNGGPIMHTRSLLVENGMKHFVDISPKGLFYLNINSIFNINTSEIYINYYDGSIDRRNSNVFRLYNFIFSAGIGLEIKISERIFSRIEFNFGMPLWRTKNNIQFYFYPPESLENIPKQHPFVPHNSLIFSLSYKIKKHEKE